MLSIRVKPWSEQRKMSKNEQKMSKNEQKMIKKWAKMSQIIVTYFLTSIIGFELTNMTIFRSVMWMNLKM